MSRTCGGDSVVEWFDNGISWKLGEGDRVRFWLDNWMGDSFDTQISKIISHIFTRKLVCVCLCVLVCLCMCVSVT